MHIVSMMEKIILSEEESGGRRSNERRRKTKPGVKHYPRVHGIMFHTLKRGRIEIGP